MGVFKLFGERRGWLVFQKKAWEAAHSGQADWLEPVMREVRVVKTTEDGAFVRLLCKSRHFDKVGASDVTPRYLPSVHMVSGGDRKAPEVSFRRMV